MNSLNNYNKNRVEACLYLLNTNEGSQHRIATCRQKWFMHDNQKRPSYWMATGDQPYQTITKNVKFTQKNLLVFITASWHNNYLLQRCTVKNCKWCWASTLSNNCDYQLLQITPLHHDNCLLYTALQTAKKTKVIMAVSSLAPILFTRLADEFLILI